MKLSENSVNINNKRNLIEAKIIEMKRIWEGELANTVLGAASQNLLLFDDVKKYEDNLNKHISTCRENYRLSEEANIQIQRDIDSMFL